MQTIRLEQICHPQSWRKPTWAGCWAAPLVGKWSMSGYVKVVRGYGASFRIVDCLNAPLWMIEASLTCQVFGNWHIPDGYPDESGYGPLLPPWRTISCFQLLYEVQVHILLVKWSTGCGVCISMTTIAKSYGTDQAGSLLPFRTLWTTCNKYRNRRLIALSRKVLLMPWPTTSSS
jgi:hypothetical protein